MNAEIISVGTEIILGQIVNTNAPFLARRLGKLDIEAGTQLTIPDDRVQLISAVQRAWQRFDLVFVCGGLGPTADDITMPGVADALGVSLVTDDQYWEWIKGTFKQRHKDMVPENIRQAQYLAGGQELANPVGLALGCWYEKNGHRLIVLPGPPAEFKAMVDQSLMPKLTVLVGQQEQISSRTLNFLGRPESELMDEIAAATHDLQGVVITSYVQPTQIQVRMTVHDQTPSQAKKLLDQAQQLILQKEGEYFFGVGDDLSLADQVVSLLKDRQLTITAAESLTGGMFQSTLCSVPGASTIFNGGFVTYAASAKEDLLGIESELIDKYGVVSSQTAAQMAQLSRQRMKADIGVGFTGVAGPDSLEGQPAGTVWLGLASDNDVITKELHLGAYNGRQAIRTLAVQYGLQMVYRALTK